MSLENPVRTQNIYQKHTGQRVTWHLMVFCGFCFFWLCCWSCLIELLKYAIVYACTMLLYRCFLARRDGMSRTVWGPHEFACRWFWIPVEPLTRSVGILTPAFPWLNWYNCITKISSSTLRDAIVLPQAASWQITWRPFHHWQGDYFEYLPLPPKIKKTQSQAPWNVIETTCGAKWVTCKMPVLYLHLILYT